jgi:hypothetical protein
VVDTNVLVQPTAFCFSEDGNGMFLNVRLLTGSVTGVTSQEMVVLMIIIN